MPLAEHPDKEPIDQLFLRDDDLVDLGPDAAEGLGDERGLWGER